MMMPHMNYVVVEVPSEQSALFASGDLSAAKELLPWADPYIAMLIEKHESDIARYSHGLHNEAVPPIGDSYPTRRSSRRSCR